MKLIHAAAAEAIGTALLLAVVVGSGIMGERLAAGNTAVALLANSLATGMTRIAYSCARRLAIPATWGRASLAIPFATRVRST